MQLVEITIPDLGDFQDIPIIEIYVHPGDRVSVTDPLLALESDKATMEIPSPYSGAIRELKVTVGETVSEGDIILTLEKDLTTGIPLDSDSLTGSSTGSAEVEDVATPVSEPLEDMTVTLSDNNPQVDLVVLGSGPGGYTAAFRAADLGLNVVLVEKYRDLGGVCLNVGCIPSKALLHVAQVIADVEEATSVGLTFGTPKYDLDAIRQWKSGVVNQLTQGLVGLARKRAITVIHGIAEFASPHQLCITSIEDKTSVSFRNAVIAVGSEPAQIPGFPYDDPRIIDSTKALDLDDIPERLLIVGGGIVGLEMATVYHALGSRISIVEKLDEIIAGADPDMVRPLLKKIQAQYDNIWTGTSVVAMESTEKGLAVSFQGPNAPAGDVFDKVLISVGRSSNGDKIHADAAGVSVDAQGFIPVDEQMRTNVPHIFAIGDVVGQPMLAHKAVHEGKVAAEVIAGLKSGFDARMIPSVAYTNPEVAWVGLTEIEAKRKNIPYEKGSFPWAASGRSLSMGRKDGITKLLFDPKTNRLIGAAITGLNAGDLIAEATLAIEMNADASDIGLTVHPHPTLAETIGMAAEAFEGTITDLYLPKSINRII